MDREENVIPPILFHLYRRSLWNEAYTPKEGAMSRLMQYGSKPTTYFLRVADRLVTES